MLGAKLEPEWETSISGRAYVAGIKSRFSGTIEKVVVEVK